MSATAALFEKVAEDIGENIFTPGKHLIAPHHCFGFDSSTRHNLEYISPGKVLYAAGNALIQLELNGYSQTCAFSIDEGGVNCFAIHPKRLLIGIGESNEKSPSIYIRKYPEFEAIKKLSGGAQKGYSCLDFNTAGDLLASVSLAPDYQLTIWNWESQTIKLHCKAFGHDIFSVRFSPDRDDRLVTSGVGHIRFWSITSTFTGLKLQGEIGRFGKIDLSDIYAFSILLDGKTLSGTASGEMLLWEDSFIKCKIMRPNNLQCHNGKIISLHLDQKCDNFISCGYDGYIKWWNYKAINEADPSGIEIEPTKQICMGEGVVPCNLAYGKSVESSENFFNWEKEHYIVVDKSTVGRGSLRILPLEKDNKKLEGNPIACFHSGSIDSVSIGQNRKGMSICVTAGEDGSVRTWDIKNKVPLEACFYAGGSSTSAIFLPQGADDLCLYVVAGYSDGVMQLLLRDQENCKLKLVQKMKPHRGKVVAMEFSPNEKWLATAGADGIVFFHKIAQTSYKYEIIPTGFVKLPSGSVPLSINWRSDSLALLAACGDIGVVEIDLSNNLIQNFDNSYTYWIENVLIQVYPLHYSREFLCKNTDSGNLTHQDLDFSSAGLNANSSDTDQESNKTYPAFNAVYINSENSPLQNFMVVHGGDQGGMLANYALDCMYPVKNTSTCNSSASSKICYLSACGPTKSPKIVTGWTDGCFSILNSNQRSGNIHLRGHSSAAKVTDVDISNDGKWLASVGTDGLLNIYRLRMQDLELLDASDLSRIYPHWSLFNNEGIGSIPTLEGYDILDNSEDSVLQAKNQLHTFCERYDPNFALKGSIPEMVEAEKDEKSFEYTIEEARINTKVGRKKAQIERNKQETKETIEKMRKKYKALCEENMKLPESIRLKAHELVVDPEYVQIMEATKEAALLETRKSLEYETDISKQQINKLKAKYFDNLEVELITIQALRWDYKVSSFRTLKLSAEMIKILEDFRAKQRNAEEELTSNSNSFKSPTMSNSLSEKICVEPLNQSQPCGDERGKNTHSNAEKISSFESRLHKRILRKKELKLLESQKPTGNVDTDNSDTAMQAAMASIGDYKLKLSHNYQVPEGQELNVRQKNIEMALLQELAHNVQMKFNKKFLELRKIKRGIIDSINRNVKRVRDIDLEIGQSKVEKLWEPKLDPSEWPELREYYTEDELQEFKIFQESNKNFGMAKLSEFCPKTSSDTEKKVDEFYLNLSRHSNVENIKQENPALSDISSYNSSECQVKKSMAGFKEFSRDSDAIFQCLPIVRGSRISSESHRSILEEDEYQINLLVLQHEKKSLILETDTLVMEFDEDVFNLRHERMTIEAELLLIKQRLITIRQEIEILKVYQTRDFAFEKKYNTVMSEKQQVDLLISTYRQQLDAKNREFKAWQEKEETVTNEFMSRVPPSNPLHLQLLKIFKQKIKRILKKSIDSEADLASSSKDQESLDFEYLDDETGLDYDDDDDELTDNTNNSVTECCPPNCGISVYESIIQLRESRVDIEETMQHLQIEIDELTRSIERQNSKLKQVEKDLSQLKIESTLLQLEKQQKLNNLVVMVPLNISQLHCIEPVDSTQVGENMKLVEVCKPGQYTLISKKVLEQLDNRTMELANEIHKEHERFREMQRERAKFDKSCIEKQAAKEVGIQKCAQMQMLKFGQLIDLEMLDSVGATFDEEEVHQKLLELEKENNAEIAKLKKEAEKVAETMFQVTKDNTKLLNRIVKLKSRKKELEKSLDADIDCKTTFDNEETSAKIEIKETMRLTELIYIQSQEIDAMKKEIFMLKCKGNNKYLPNPPNKSSEHNVKKNKLF